MPFMSRTSILLSTVSFVASRIAAASVLAGAVTAALMLPAGEAVAYCDAADCVPNVARDVVAGAPCVPQHFYDFGLDANSKAVVCVNAGVWAPAEPLVGVREVAVPCAARNDSAQQPDGAALKCAQVNATLRWVYRDDTPG
jgi:hypothetical protein